MSVLDPLTNLPTLFPLETFEKIPSIPETRCAKHFGGKTNKHNNHQTPPCFVLGWVIFFFPVGTAYISDKCDFCHGVLEQSFFHNNMVGNRNPLTNIAFVCLLYNSDNLTKYSRYQDALLFDLTNSFSFLCCLCAEYTCSFMHFMLLL